MLLPSQYPWDTMNFNCTSFSGSEDYSLLKSHSILSSALSSTQLQQYGSGHSWILKRNHLTFTATMILFFEVTGHHYICSLFISFDANRPKFQQIL